MTTELNYTPYKQPRKALYNADTAGKYVKNPESGFYEWENKQVETTVIGEDATCFITQLIETRNSDSWDKDYGKTEILPLGFHKSRLIQWLLQPGEQLRLFE